MALIPVKKLSEVGNRVRQTTRLTTLVLAPNASESFAIECGSTAIVQRLAVNSPCVVEVFGVEDHNPIDDPNPYKFIATDGHLMDDGTTFFRDGTTLKTRQYSIFVNLETPKRAQMYGKITNTGTSARSITLDLTYLIVEDL